MQFKTAFAILVYFISVVAGQDTSLGAVTRAFDAANVSTLSFATFPELQSNDAADPQRPSSIFRSESPARCNIPRAVRSSDDVARWDSAPKKR